MLGGKALKVESIRTHIKCSFLCSKISLLLKDVFVLAFV